MTSLDRFRNRFAFDPQRSLWVGVERERFLTNGTGIPVPRAADALQQLGISGTFGYELSACQLESKTSAAPIEHLESLLIDADQKIEAALAPLGLHSLHNEVAPEHMPLDVYPDPTGRYQEIIASMTRQELLAACRIIGTHVHVGMPDHATALRVYNRVIRHTSKLCALGDNSNGQRLAIYRSVSPQCNPDPYENWPELHCRALECGFADDPRRCWTLIRISVHGTIEFRMFGTTKSTKKVVVWARTCHKLCRDAMN